MILSGDWPSEPSWVSALTEAARAEGFPHSGIVDVDAAVEAFRPHGERYRAWIEAGFHGEMAYLARGQERRLDVRKVFSEAQSVFVVLLPYRPLTDRPEGRAWLASYLEGPDYHDDMKARLQRVLERAKVAKPGLTGKACVDTSAVLERSWAALTGLGWIGKNTLLLTKEWGSYTFLGVMLLNAKSGRGPTRHPDLCGQCRACLDACPTRAFQEPRRLDARRCLSYLTLEKRGEFSGTEKTAMKSGRAWIAGCDVCQDVCPFNRKTQRDQGLPANLSRWTDRVPRWTDVMAYARDVQGSALSRIRPPEMKRNLSILADLNEPESE